MSTETRFYLGDVLSITTGKLLSPKGMQGVYGILNFMTGEDLMTHQLVRASVVCSPELVAQHPFLNYVDVPEKFEDEDHALSWLHEKEDLYGEFLTVKPLPEGVYEIQDPLVELFSMRGSADGTMVVDVQ